MHELSAPTSKPSEFNRVVDPFCVRLLLSLIHGDFSLYEKIVSITDCVLDQGNRQSCIRRINDLYDVTRFGCKHIMSMLKKGQGTHESCTKRIKESRKVLM